MNDDKELQALETLYKKSGIKLDKPTPARLDDAVLLYAKDKLVSSKANTERNNIVLFQTKIQRWQLPLSLAAGILLGMLLNPLVEIINPGQNSSSELVFMGGQDALTIPIELEEAGAEEWKKYILTAIENGDMQEAAALINEFNRRFQTSKASN